MHLVYLSTTFYNFTRSLDRLYTLSPRYIMVTWLTHESGVAEREGWGVERKGRGSVEQNAWEMGEFEGVRKLIHQLAHRSL